MFTGIIEEVGTVKAVTPGAKAGEIMIGARKVLEDTKIGDSIAVNGVCLTVTRMTDSYFTADVMPETLRRSSLGTLHTGSGVNLERAMAANGASLKNLPFTLMMLFSPIFELGRL